MTSELWSFCLVFDANDWFYDKQFYPPYELPVTEFWSILSLCSERISCLSSFQLFFANLEFELFDLEADRGIELQICCDFFLIACSVIFGVLDYWRAVVDALIVGVHDFALSCMNDFCLLLILWSMFLDERLSSTSSKTSFSFVFDLSSFISDFWPYRCLLGRLLYLPSPPLDAWEILSISDCLYSLGLCLFISRYGCLPLVDVSGAQLSEYMLSLTWFIGGGL